MTHTVDVTATPKAAAPLAALYVATRDAKPGGKAVGRPDRLKLARAVGPGDLADLLKSDAPIRVRPGEGDRWEVRDVTESVETADAVLARVLGAEAARQGLSHRELARRSGELQTTISRVLANDREPRWTTVLGILAGLGKSLTWLDRQLNQTPDTPTG